MMTNMNLRTGFSITIGEINESPRLPVTIKDMKARMAKIIKQDDYYKIVAESDGKLVGMAGLHRGLS
ncbi:hypothetical protein HRF87_10190 [Bacillus sp. CRN 9]|nr:hypothetical protein [Bacillus sp. CRN 9]